MVSLSDFFAPSILSSEHIMLEKHYYMRGVKLFGDGALGSRGAALIDDYSDQPGWKGLMLKKEEVWGPLINQWYEAVSGTDIPSTVQS